MAADWADGLPYDLMANIFERMETFDQARFACVCTRWRFVAKQAKLRRRPTLRPWTMLPPTHDGTERDGTCTFFGFPSMEATGWTRGRMCSITLPEFIWRSCSGTSPEGWVFVLGKNQELCVVNPLTSDRLILPPTETIPEVAMKLTSPRASAGKNYCINLLFNYFKKAIVFELPPHGLMVAATVDSRLHWLVLAKVGGEAWTVAHKPASILKKDYVEDIAVYGSKLYGVTQCERLLACDLTNVLSADPVPTTVYQVLDRPPVGLHQHLVSFFSPPPPSLLPGTSLLVILRYHEMGGSYDYEAPMPMHVVRLEQVSDSAFRCVDDVRSLGGHCIFLDDWYGCIALPVDRECREVKEDLIYNTRLYDDLCWLEVVDLSNQLLGSHYLGGVECSYYPSSIHWFWPAPGF